VSDLEVDALTNVVAKLKIEICLSSPLSIFDVGCC